MRTATNPSVLVVVAIGVALLTNLLATALYGELPTLPVSAGVVLGALGVGETVLGVVLRNRIARRKGAKPVDALSTARAVALAKASSLAGAAVGGAWAGLLAFLLPRRDEVAAAARDVPSAVIGVIGAVVLVGGALWLEYCCRNPDDGDPSRDPSRDHRPGPSRD